MIDDLAPMLVLITLILTTGAVLLLRPIAKRLGELLELMAKQRSGELKPPHSERMETLLESLDTRLDLVEERLDFTDSLLQARREGERLQVAPPAESGSELYVEDPSR